MTEVLNQGGTENQSRNRTTVGLARNLRNALDLARRTGGNIEYQGTTPWTITYKGATILWAGYPDKRPGVLEATPYLNNDAPVYANGWLGVDAVILSRRSATFINPGFGHDDSILGCTFTDREIQEFETPIAEASKAQIKARAMARRASQRRTPHPIRIERG